MRRLILIGALAGALALAGSAAAALVPGVYDPGHTGCPTATYANGVLHLAKNCATSTDAAAGADITGLAGQTFSSASFTLASASQCQGGSPRFDVVTTNGTTSTTYFLGCNNVTPTTNPNGTATYVFTPATLAAAGNQVPFPSGTISSAEVLIDVQGTADLSDIVVNGQLEQPAAPPPPPRPTSKDQCKHGGWRSFTSPSFRNQGQCVSSVASQKHATGHGEQGEHPLAPHGHGHGHH